MSQSQALPGRSTCLLIGLADSAGGFERLLSIPLVCAFLIVGGTLLVRKAWQWSEHDIDAISDFLEQTIGAARAP